MTLAELNALEESGARAELLRCCGSSRWVEAMSKRRPFAGKDSLLDAAREIWRALGPADWREAFTHHPKIGDLDSLKKKFSATAGWASGEQAGAAGASEATLRALAQGNADYEKRFGYIFIVCATGKRADEMLVSLLERLGNDPERELAAAAGEQEKITALRLEKLLAQGVTSR